MWIAENQVSYIHLYFVIFLTDSVVKYFVPNILYFIKYFKIFYIYIYIYALEDKIISPPMKIQLFLKYFPSAF